MKQLFSIMLNLQTHYYFKLDYQNWNNPQEASGSSTAPNTTRTISSKAWNSPTAYPRRESKQGTKESEPVIIVNPVIILSTM